MSLANPLISAFRAAAIFESMTAPIMQDEGFMVVDPTVDDEGGPQLIVHADDETLRLAMAVAGPAISLARMSAGHLFVAEVPVEYRLIQPVMEVR